MLSRALLRALGAWCGVYVLAASLVPGWEDRASTVFFYGVLLIAPTAILVRPHLPRPWGASLALVGSLALAIFLSLVANLDQPYIGTIARLAVAQIVVLGMVLHLATAYRDELRHLYVAYAVVGAGALLAVMAHDGWSGEGRLGGILNPNSLGMLGAGVICAAQALGNRLLRVVVVLAALAVVLATGSRSALLGSLVGLSVPYILVREGRGRRIAVVVVLLAAAALGVYGLGGGQRGALSDRLDQTLALSDSHRGLDSGFTGRTRAWEIGLALWREAPVFGHGYRAQDQIFADADENIENLSSTHNGWLAMLVDTGVAGLTPYLALIVAALLGLHRADLKHPVVRASGSLVVAYSFFAFFERYALNIGNPVSTLALLSALVLSIGPALVVSTRQTMPMRLHPAWTTRSWKPGARAAIRGSRSMREIAR